LALTEKGLGMGAQIQSFLDEQFPNTKDVHAQNAEKFMAAYKSLTPTLKSSGVLFCDSASGFHLCGADYGWRVLGLWKWGSRDFS